MKQIVPWYHHFRSVCACSLVPNVICAAVASIQNIAKNPGMARTHNEMSRYTALSFGVVFAVLERFLLKNGRSKQQ